MAWPPAVGYRRLVGRLDRLGFAAGCLALLSCVPDPASIDAPRPDAPLLLPIDLGPIGCGLEHIVLLDETREPGPRGPTSLVFTGDDLVLARVDPTAAGGPELLVERRRLDGSIAMPIVASAVHDDARRGLLARASGSGAMLYVMGSDPSGAPGSAAVLLDAVVLDPSGASASPVPPVTTGAIRLVPRGMRARESVLFARSDRFVLGGALAGDVTGADEWVAQAIEIGVDGRALRTAPLQRHGEWLSNGGLIGIGCNLDRTALRLRARFAPSPPERFDLTRVFDLDRFSIGADVIATGEGESSRDNYAMVEGSHGGVRRWLDWWHWESMSARTTETNVRVDRERVIIPASPWVPAEDRSVLESARVVAFADGWLLATTVSSVRTDGYLAPRGEWSVRLQRLDPEGAYVGQVSLGDGSMHPELVVAGNQIALTWVDTQAETELRYLGILTCDP